MEIPLAFIHGYESKHYAGPLRPFINWTESLIKDCPEINPSLILFKSNPKIIENFTPKLREKTILLNDNDELLRVIRDLSPDIIMSDDYFLRLKILEKIVKDYAKTKTIIYIQFLYGIHSISNCFYYGQIPFKEKFAYRISSLFPYKVLSLRYIKMLRKHNVFISNSNISKNLFFWLYKLHVDDVVYPPINIDIFKPYNNSTDSDEVLIYLGSSGGDVNLNFIYRIIKTIIKRNFKVSCFGNERLSKIMRETFNKDVEYYKNLGDVELAKLYSKSLVTICPQTWELFGYTAIESMACRTPVLAFNYFGHSETIINGKTGLLANTEDEFIEKLKLILDKYVEFNRSYIRQYVVKMFSAEKSANKLVEFIKNVYNYESK